MWNKRLVFRYQFLPGLTIDLQPKSCTRERSTKSDIFVINELVSLSE
jgi:hypothetical protein